MSTFSGLSTALSALYAQRRGLDVTGQNVANANTEGYSRQRPVLEAVGAPVTPAFFSTYEGAGGGVDVADVQRLRDAFLEVRGQTEHGRMAFLAERSDALARVEDLLAEPGDTALQEQLADFWNGWQDVANSPGDPAARSQLLQRAGTLVDTLHAADTALRTSWTATRTELRALVDEVNTTAANVADLNVAIKRNVQIGSPASELRDRRDVLVMRLAELTGAATRASDDGTLDVFLGGTTLVRGASSAALQVGGAALFDQETASPPVPVRVTWAQDGSPAAVEQGRAAGMLDTLNATLPGMATRLDAFTAQLVTRVNEVHRTGYGLDGATGRDFFVASGTGIHTVALAVRDERHVAASRYGGDLDHGKADEVAAVSTEPNGPDATYRQLVVDLGVQAQTASRRAEIQGNITTQVDAAREAEAGVDVDEEMVNMLAFQRAYEGAARMLTAVDQALDTLINRTGLVGR